MKIAVTGASGDIGRRIVPLLPGLGYQPLLFDSDPVSLKSIFPEFRCYADEQLASSARGCIAVLHLAARTNRAGAAPDDGDWEDLQLLDQVLDAADQADVHRLVNVLSTRDLENQADPHTTSKRTRASLINPARRTAGVNLYCAKVYKSDRARVTTHPLVWKAIGAVKPIVEADQLAECLQEAVSQMRSEEIICTATQQNNPFYRAGQSLMDVVLATAVLLLLGWAMILISVAIRLDSRGPSIFAQVRVGQHGKLFTCYKYRTMHVGTLQAGTHQISNTAVTSLGRWLRRTKIDELPQVWNVLRRELSFVGPRPCLPSQLELIEERAIRGVYEVKPGITGLAQVNDIDMSMPRKLAEWDRRYVALQSLWTDVRILFLTVRGKGAGDRTNNRTEAG